VQASHRKGAGTEKSCARPPTNLSFDSCIYLKHPLIPWRLDVFSGAFITTEIQFQRLGDNRSGAT
jgi:hypothetical protein